MIEAHPEFSGSVAVAADHSDVTLRRYLAGVEGAAVSLEDSRRLLVLAADAAGADSIVVRQEDLAWGRRSCPNVQLIVGLPDATTPLEMERLLDEAASARHLSVPVKFGFVVNRETVSASASAVASILHRNKTLRVVAEPYFDSRLEVDIRCELLKQLGRCERLIAFKLDIEAPERDARAYSTAAAGLPWLARSEGLDYQTFRTRLGLAIAHGCAGVMAGAAIWRSEFARVVRTGSIEYAQVVVRKRIDELRTLVATGRG